MALFSGFSWLSLKGLQSVNLDLDFLMLGSAFGIFDERTAVSIAQILICGMVYIAFVGIILILYPSIACISRDQLFSFFKLNK